MRLTASHLSRHNFGRSSLLGEDALQPSGDLRRLVDDFFGEVFKLIAANGLGFPAALFHFVEHLGIFEQAHESVAENFQAPARNVRRGQDRPRAKAPDAQIGINQAALGVADFVLLHQLENRRHVWQLVVTFLFGLENNTDTAFFHPGVKRFPAEKAVDRDGAALNLVALHRKILLRAPRIAADHAKFETKGLFEQAWNVVSGAADAGGGTARRIVRLTEIVEALERRVGAYEE